MITLKLTLNQLDALQTIFQDAGISDDEPIIHGNTINSLNKKGLITHKNYANGGYWSITDKGMPYLPKLY